MCRPPPRLWRQAFRHSAPPAPSSVRTASIAAGALRLPALGASRKAMWGATASLACAGYFRSAHVLELA